MIRPILVTVSLVGACLWGASKLDPDLPGLIIAVGGFGLFLMLAVAGRD